MSGIAFSFDSKADDAVKVAEKQAAKMVTEISAETEANIRNLVARAIREGIPPYEAANLIEPLIGLTSAQGQAAWDYRQRLVDGGLAPEKVQEKFSEYADELLTSRAETIARSEIMDALNGGLDEAWQQAQDEGLLSEDATKEIILDDEACDVCVALAKQGPVPIGDEFDEGDPPFHPRCRCTIGIAKP